MTDWLLFLGSAAVVVMAGVKLSQEGDTIAERTALGGALIGAILIAAATSLPELATTGFATAQGSVGLALGDLFGTLMVNMAMLAIAVTVIAGPNIFNAGPENAALPALIAAGLCATAAVTMLVGEPGSFFGVGWGALLIGVLYLGGVWLLGTDRAASGGQRKRPSPGSLRPALIRFGVASLAIVAAAYALAMSARAIADTLGIGQTFVGAAMVGVVTSLPEATVAFAAFSRGAHGIGLGALFGSNAFDVVIVLPLDVLNGAEPILEQAEDAAAVSALFAVLLMTMAVAAIVARGDRRIGGRVEPVAVAMLLVYALGLFMTYRAGT